MVMAAQVHYALLKKDASSATDLIKELTEEKRTEIPRRPSAGNTSQPVRKMRTVRPREQV